MQDYSSDWTNESADEFGTSEDSSESGEETTVLMLDVLPVFVFGAVDVIQRIINNSMMDPKYRERYRIHLSLGFVYLYIYDRILQRWVKDSLIRQPYGRAIRPRVYINELYEEQTSTCRVCFERNMNVMIKPCNHIGLCNMCCVRHFKCGFYRLDQTPTLSSTRLLFEKKCPFCFGSVTGLDYVFIT
jgi:hypothetical protein